MPAEAPPAASVSAARTRWRGEAAEAGVRDIPEETAVALVHDAATTAVMMATPLDLEDFACGFSLTEGLVTAIDQISAMEVVSSPLGVEVRAWLTSGPSAMLASRRRRLAGATGCGLCGIDSLEEAVRAPPRVATGLVLRPGDIDAAMAALSQAQTLGAATRAVHAAGWWSPTDGLVAVREDVGRHNALDKLAGALARAGQLGQPGAVLLTSRVSVEMVQKACAIGAQAVIAVSAPTALAVRTAEAAGLTLIAVARPDSFEVFTRGERVAA